MIPEDGHRKSHVVRFYGKDDNSDCWVDVEILDRITFKSGRYSQYKATTVNYEDLAGKNETRRNKTKRIVNRDDESQYVDIEVPEAIAVDSKRFYDYLKIQKWYRNTEDNKSRKTTVRRIIHNGIDDRFLDGEDNPPSDPREYLDAVIATGEKDEDQYLKIELIDHFVTKSGRGFKYQKVVFTPRWGNSLLLQKLPTASAE